MLIANLIPTNENFKGEKKNQCRYPVLQITNSHKIQQLKNVCANNFNLK